MNPVDYHGYKVYCCGKVVSPKGRTLKQRLDKDGYLRVNLYIDKRKTTIRVHKLVALCFLTNRYLHPHVHHIDHNKTNNNLFNLEWVSVEYNNQNKKRPTASEVVRETL